MITGDRIKEYAILGEGYTVDFKASLPSKVRDVTEEICSFANASGGFVLIGIDNTGAIIGAEIDNNRRSALQGSIGEISPALHCDIYSVKVNDKSVWVVEVPSGINKPYSFGGCIYSIIDYVTQNPKLKVEDLAKHLNRGKSYVYKQISTLKDLSILEKQPDGWKVL